MAFLSAAVLFVLFTRLSHLFPFAHSQMFCTPPQERVKLPTPCFKKCWAERTRPILHATLSTSCRDSSFSLTCRSTLSVTSKRWRLPLPVSVMQNVYKSHLRAKMCVFVFQGDYDVVINDYEKAKSLFGNTEVPVFKKGDRHFNHSAFWLIEIFTDLVIYQLFTYLLRYKIYWSTDTIIYFIKCTHL